jgi:hypothetical protein
MASNDQSAATTAHHAHDATAQRSSVLDYNDMNIELDETSRQNAEPENVSALPPADVNIYHEKAQHTLTQISPCPEWKRCLELPSRCIRDGGHGLGYVLHTFQRCRKAYPI